MRECMRDKSKEEEKEEEGKGTWRCVHALLVLKAPCLAPTPISAHAKTRRTSCTQGVQQELAAQQARNPKMHVAL